MTDIDRARTGLRALSFKFEPMAWLTTAGVVLGAILEADREWHLLPGGVVHWLAFAAGAIALVLVGLRARKAATPTADPRTDAGTPLVPVTVAPYLRLTGQPDQR